MAKGSNNARSKKTHSSKPYDISNSFVRKVASRVTSLISQPSWLSKWFVSSNEDNTAVHEEQPETDVSEYRSSKRPKIDINRPFPPNSFRVAHAACDGQVLTEEEEERETRYSPQRASAETTRYSSQRISNQLPRLSPQRIYDESARFPPQRITDEPVRFPLQRVSESDRHTPHKIPDEPVAGPSGFNESRNRLSFVESDLAETEKANTTSLHRNIRPRPSLSTYLNQSSSTSHAERKMNGDNVSESSESTSGCSSLPHPVTQQPSSHNRVSSANKNYDSPALSHSHRSLLLNRARSPRVNTPLSRRKTLFSVSAFGTPSLESDSSLSKSAVINSPFYVGRTGYGGASAYRRSRDVTPEVQPYRSSSVEVQPVNSGSSNSSNTLATMSYTTRRIMEALEQFASPVQSTRKSLADNPALPVLATKRPRTELTVTEQKTSLRQLTIPTVPDLIKLRRREKLQDSLESARLIARATERNSYQLRIEENSRTGKVIGRKTNIDDEETVKEVNLPSISLPITVLPKFDIEVPPQQHTAPLSACTFKYASPHFLNDMSRTEPSDKSFTFSEPLIVSENSEQQPNVNKTFQPGKEISDQLNLGTQLSTANRVTSSDVSQGTSSSETTEKKFTGFKFVPPDYKLSNTIPNFKACNEAKSDSISDNVPSVSQTKTILDPLKTDVANSKNVILNSSFGNIVKASSDTWECGTCLIRNKLSASRCIACTAPRESPHVPITSKISSPANNPEKVRRNTWQDLNKMEKPDPNNKFKTSTVLGSPKYPSDLNENVTKKDKWECPTCWIKNPEALSKCQACETNKPQEKPKTKSYFGEKLSKPPETWECPTCMIRNKNEVLKCAACEEPKPGSSAPAPSSKSTLKFNLAIPAEASKFSFGVDKSNVSVMSEPTKGFKFGETKTTAAATGFTFGVGVSSVRSAHATSTETKSSQLNKSAGDGVCNLAVKVVKSPNISKISDLQSEKQLNVAKVNQNSDVSCAVTGKPETSSSSLLVSHSASEVEKTIAESTAGNFKFSVPNNSSESTLFSFGVKPNSVIRPSTSSETSSEANDKSFSTEDNGKFVKPSPNANENNTQKTEKGLPVVEIPNVPTTAPSVPVTTTNTHFTTKEVSTKSAQVNAVTSLPESLPNKGVNSVLPLLTSQKTVSASVTTSDPHVSSPGKRPIAKSLFSNSSPHPVFGTAVSPTNISKRPANFTVPATAVPSFTSGTSSVQQNEGVKNSAIDTPSFGGSTPSVLNFSSASVTSTQGFGSTPSLSLSAPSTTVTNFGSDKPVLDFGSSTTSNTNACTSAFASSLATPTPSPGNLFGAQKSATEEKFNTTETLTNSFSANSTANFGASTGNLTGFGTPSTTSQPFGIPTTTPAFGLVAPSFGAASPQNFGSVTTSAPSFGTPVPGPFNAKPPIETGVKVSSSATPFGFSANSSSAPLFTFGSAQTNSSELSGPAVKQPNFTFGNPSTSAPVGQTPGSGFGFSSFASNSTPSLPGGPTVPIFGSGATAAPAFGSGGNTGFTAPSFFGQASQTNSNVFGFSSNQGSNAAQPSQNAVSAFNFSASQPSGLPTFNPNVKPSFNFTGGSTPNFTAEATAPTPPTQRRIKKAVRRTQTRTNVM